MNIRNTNAVQLAIAGIVVVLVAICGTFAWFAANERAGIKGVEAVASSPTIESGISEIQYNVNGNWNTYDGKVPLKYVPGHNVKFRVIFYAAPTQNITLKMTNIKVGAEGEETDSFTQGDFSGALPKLCKALEYRVKLSDTDSGEYVPLLDKIDLEGDNNPVAVVFGPETVDQSAASGQMYTYYYDLSLPGSVGNEYFDCSLMFDLALIIS